MIGLRDCEFMQDRSPFGRVILGLLLALSLAVGSGAGVAAAAASNPGVAGGAMLTLPGPAPLSTVHVNGMRHGQDRGSAGGTVDQMLCLVACLGLTAAPSLPTPDVALALPRPAPSPYIAVRDAGDQVLSRPTSPPPRAIAAI